MTDPAAAPDLPHGAGARADLAGGPSTWSEATLLAAMRRERPASIAEFYLRYAPLLRRLGRRWGLADADAEQVATDTLTDVALALLAPDAVAPRALASYVATALRHRLGMAHRGQARRAARDGGLETTADATPVRRRARVAEPPVVRALCSSYALRASAGPDPASAADVPSPDPALLRLVQRLESELREPDRLLLVWTAHHVPLRTIAEWLGVGYEATVKRAARLRTRLRAVVAAHADALPADDRRRLHRILARAGALDLDPVEDAAAFSLPPARRNDAAPEHRTPEGEP